MLQRRAPLPLDNLSLGQVGRVLVEHALTFVKMIFYHLLESVPICLHTGFGISPSAGQPSAKIQNVPAKPSFSAMNVAILDPRSATHVVCNARYRPDPTLHCCDLKIRCQTSDQRRDWPLHCKSTYANPAPNVKYCKSRCQD
jgi:hypothetical protein